MIYKKPDIVFRNLNQLSNIYLKYGQIYFIIQIIFKVNNIPFPRTHPPLPLLLVREGGRGVEFKTDTNTSNQLNIHFLYMDNILTDSKKSAKKLEPFPC